MKQLKITIEGAPATGKTTLAMFLNDALASAGFNVKLVDDEDNTNGRSPELQAYCLAELVKANLQVEMETVMAPKEPAAFEEPSWSPRRSGAEALIMAMYGGGVRGRGQFTVRELHEADFVAMVDPEDDGHTGVVCKCRYGIYRPGAILTHEHLADIALAYSALSYANDRAFVGAKHRRRASIFFDDLVEARRVLTTESRRIRLAALIAQLM